MPPRGGRGPRCTPHPGPEFISRSSGPDRLQKRHRHAAGGPRWRRGIPPDTAVQKRNPFALPASLLSFFLVDPGPAVRAEGAFLVGDRGAGLIAKAPAPGRSKTRLCPPCPPQQAAALAEASLRDTIAAMSETPARQPHRRPRGGAGWLASPRIRGVHAQRGDGLAARLGDALLAAGPCARGRHGHAPSSARHSWRTRRARVTEPGIDAVLGPAVDGGYWAIGLGRPDARIQRRADGAVRHGAAQRRRLDRWGCVERLVPPCATWTRSTTPRRSPERTRRPQFATAFMAQVAGHSVRNLAISVRSNPGDGPSGRRRVALRSWPRSRVRQDRERLPPAAEPAKSPPLERRRPATIVRRPQAGRPRLRSGYRPARRRAHRTPTDSRSSTATPAATSRRVQLPESPRHWNSRAGGPVLVPAEQRERDRRVPLPVGRWRATAWGASHTRPRRPRPAVRRRRARPHALGRRRRAASRRCHAPSQPGGVAVTGDGHAAVVGVRERALEVFDARARRGRWEGERRDRADARGRRAASALRRRTRGEALLELRRDPLRLHRRPHLGRACPTGSRSTRTPAPLGTLTARTRWPSDRPPRRAPRPDRAPAELGDGRPARRPRVVASRKDGDASVLRPRAGCRGERSAMPTRLSAIRRRGPSAADSGAVPCGARGWPSSARAPPCCR